MYVYIYIYGQQDMYVEESRVESKFQQTRTWLIMA